MKILMSFLMLFICSLPVRDIVLDVESTYDLCEQEQDPIRVGQSTVLTFSSNPDKGLQEQAIYVANAGTYTVTLSNENPRFSNHWMIWDYIGLKDGNRVAWSIGKKETPPDYSETAFDEFCDPKDQACETNFIVNETGVQDFPKEINDGSIPELNIFFEIKPSQVRRELTLVFSTLFSTHDNIKNYKMRVALKK